MPDKTMTLNLSEKEMAVLEDLCVQQDLNKTAMLRQCLRLYQMVHNRIKDGEKMFWKDKDGKEIIEVVFGCMGE